MSFYQKYRPKKIAELDLSPVRQVMSAVMTSGKPSHAYLFVGPRGLGKTSAARVLAKLLNCEKNKSGKQWGEPCGECGMCRGVDSGTVVDVVEIDAASNTGVDKIRELREKLGLAPVEARVKVFIMDEVHMLSASAFNALLKTLEEPPEGVVFVLCTTEEDKVPKTIASRCVKVVFRKPNHEELMTSLRKVISGEGLEAEVGALELLAENVDGSFREGHKLLEQLAQVNKKISLSAVRELVTGSADMDIERLLQLMLARDAKAMISCIDQMGSKGANWLSVVRILVEKLRLELRACVGIGERQNEEVGVEQITQALNELMMMPSAMKQAVDEQLPLELMAASFIENNEGGKAAKVVEPKEVKPVVAETRAEVNVTGIDMSLVHQKWAEVLTTLAPKNHSVAGLLRSTKPKAIEGKYLILEVFYKFHKEQLEQELKRRMLEEVLAEKVGPLSVKCVLGQRAAEAALNMPKDDNIKLISTDEVQMATAVADIFGVETN